MVTQSNVQSYDKVFLSTKLWRVVWCVKTRSLKMCCLKSDWIGRSDSQISSYEVSFRGLLLSNNADKDVSCSTTSRFAVFSKLITSIRSRTCTYEVHFAGFSCRTRISRVIQICSLKKSHLRFKSHFISSFDHSNLSFNNILYKNEKSYDHSDCDIVKSIKFHIGNGDFDRESKEIQKNTNKVNSEDER